MEIPQQIPVLAKEIKWLLNEGNVNYWHENWLGNVFLIGVFVAIDSNITLDQVWSKIEWDKDTLLSWSGVV